MAIPIPTPIGLDIANANEYPTVSKNGLFGIILRRAIPIAMAAKILCNEIVHRFLHASAFVSIEKQEVLVLINYVGYL